ncbi:hypothetical protein P344_00085 [Spiroplasma mirum ATCC 29335]|uniref:Uncharacterized protein n=1 Tax=Spiroplasma mirum ATCC 29335 TaxID=838561 RepID=W6AK55_9MOLU|nr:hypothetical protein P344_00085 [Spiroplasma mirum ATCC 29335]
MFNKNVTAGDILETIIKIVEDYLTINQLVMENYQMKMEKLN